MAPKKKILHLITGLEIGGAEMMLWKTLPALQDDFENTVCCIRGRGPMGDRLAEAGVSVIYLDLVSFFDWRVIGRFRTIIKNTQPDLLVTYLIHADLFGRVLGRIFGIKKIFCSVRVKLIQPKYLPLLLLDGLTSFLVNRYHFNSQSVATLYQKYFLLPKRKCTVIPNGLDVAKYHFSEEIRLAKRRELGLTDNLVLGCLAKLRAQKGHSYLLEAFQSIHTQHPHTRLLLIGDGEERQRLESLAVTLSLQDAVIFLGNRNDVPELLATIDIFVFPTLFEGMSNALMEAMASGLPIVATDIPENKELLVHDMTGILVPTRNPEALAQAIHSLITHKEKTTSLKTNARKVALQKFSLERIVSQYRELFQD